MRVALYPHSGFKVDTVATCLRLTEAVNREHVGVSFNLCHFLKQNDETQLAKTLCSAKDKLFLVSLNGADSGDTQSMGWDQLIRPLGEGSFNTKKVFRLLDKIGYDGPILLQCFNIPQPDRQHLATSMNYWKSLMEK